MTQKCFTTTKVSTHSGSISSTEYLFIVLLPFLLFAHLNLQCTTVGSNTAVAIESFTSFLQTGTDNTMLGFGSFSNGFQLISNTTSCTFDDFFPVGGPIYLNGGTLYLKEDLYLANVAIGSLGTIIGNNHAVTLAPQNQTIVLPYLGSLGTFNLLNSKATTAAPVTCNWSSDGKYLAVGTYSGGNEVSVYLFDGSTLTFTAGTHLGFNVKNIAWQPTSTSPYHLVVGTAQGLYAFSYVPSGTLATTSIILTGTNFQAVAWHPSGNIVAVGQNSFTTQQVQLYNFSATGTLTYNTSYSFPSTSVLYPGFQDLDFDYTGSYLAVALNYTYPISTNSLQVLNWNGFSLQLTTSYYPGDYCSAVNWSPDGAYIAAGYQGRYMWIYGFNRTSSTLSQMSLTNFNNAVNGISWSHNKNFIAVGLSSGATSYNLQLFAFSPSALTLIAEYYFSNGIYQTKWNYNDTVLAATSPNVVDVFNFLSGGTMTFSNAGIVFSSPVQLNGGLSFAGKCRVYGNDKILNFNGQPVTVAAGSSVLFKNCTLEGITGTNVQCLDNTGTISFDNVICMINNSMQWSQGSLAIIGDSEMTGTGAFIYSSNQTSTIYSHAQWFFDRGMTFSYYPLSGATNLINFIDSSAQLYLYATNLYAAATGMHLTKGCLFIDGPCQFLSDSTSETYGIWIGDGTAADDLKVKILAESGIIVGKGYVSYRNTH